MLMDAMSKTAEQVCGLQRVVTGNRCEVIGCYEMAIWMVSYGSKLHHWCARHTRVNMREPSLWTEKRQSPARKS